MSNSLRNYRTFFIEFNFKINSFINQIKWNWLTFFVGGRHWTKRSVTAPHRDTRKWEMLQSQQHPEVKFNWKGAKNDFWPNKKFRTVGHKIYGPGGSIGEASEKFGQWRWRKRIFFFSCVCVSKGQPFYWFHIYLVGEKIYFERGVVMTPHSVENRQQWAVFF